MSDKERKKAKNKDVETQVQEQTEVAQETVADDVEVEVENVENPLQAEVDSLKKQLEVKDDQLKRTAAEYDNYRRRTAKEITLISSDVKVDTLKQLLPIIDNVERALQYKDSSNVEDIIKGLEMIKNQTNDIFTKLGVEAIADEKVDFNPELHNAVMHVEDENEGDNQVVQMLQKGYKIGDKVLRHAMVKVAN